MIERQLFSILTERVKKGKVLVLTGPRQVGKTTILKALQASFTEKTLWLNCDEPDVRKYLTEVTSTQLNTLIGNAEIILIDEAQRVKNIGLTLKFS
jgi:predicted AAA+ superfamily ATPase